MTKNIAIITIITIALIALGGAAAYIGLRQAPDQEGRGQRGEEVKIEQPAVTLPELPEEPVVQPEEPTATEPIDTSDWKVYIPPKRPFTIHLLTPVDGKRDQVILSVGDLPFPPFWTIGSLFRNWRKDNFEFKNAEISPDGEKIAFTVEFKNEGVVRAAIYFRSFGQIVYLTSVDTISDLKWSSDGRYLAFISQGGAGVGVVEIYDTSKFNPMSWLSNQYFQRSWWSDQFLKDLYYKKYAKGRLRWISNDELIFIVGSYTGDPDEEWIIKVRDQTFRLYESRFREEPREEKY